MNTKMLHQLRQLPSTLKRYLSTSAVTTPSEAISLLKSQPSHYIIAQLHLRRYLLTANDILTVPRLAQLRVGDRIQLSRILEIGSRDYTLRTSSTLCCLNSKTALQMGSSMDATKLKLDQAVLTDLMCLMSPNTIR